MVEAALLLPIMLTILIGTFEAGRAWLDYNMLTHAVREASRMAAVTPVLKVKDMRVFDKLNEVLTDANIQVDYGDFMVVYSGNLRTGSIIRVWAVTNFEPVVTGLLPDSWAIAIPLRAEIVTRYEV